jgi:drug/metabolite transporter (DMT)-like permease
MYNIIRHAHSGLRWIVLALLIIAIVNAFLKWRGKQSYGDSDTKINRFAMIFVHVQVLIGFVVYFISPKVQFAAASMKTAFTRFYLVEHLTIMLAAAILITFGHIRVKRRGDQIVKHKLLFWYYLIGLLLILLGIPWPFQEYGAGWF